MQIFSVEDKYSGNANRIIFPDIAHLLSLQI